MTNPLRQDLDGAPVPADRLWRVTGPTFVAGLTEYNDEVTGVAPILRRWCKYGDNACWFLREFCPSKGWKVEHVEEWQ